MEKIDQSEKYIPKNFETQAKMHPADWKYKVKSIDGGTIPGLSK
jgi:hypothetical protein